MVTDAAVDAVIVGSGPNGLAAAITLGRAGWRVRVVEGHATVGGGMRTLPLTAPGFQHDICSAVHPLGMGSPFFQKVDLAQHGLRWIQPPLPVAHPLDDNEINREEAASNKNTTTSPSVLELLLEAHPNEHGHGADVWDPSGRLPLHIALEAGKRWGDGIGALVAAYPESVAMADRSTKLYPYQLAATKDNLHNTYALLRLNPTLLMSSSSSPRNVASLTGVKK